MSSRSSRRAAASTVMRMRRGPRPTSSIIALSQRRCLGSSSSSSSLSSLKAFDADTAISPLSQHHFRGHVTGRWSVGDAPNGGYLMSMAISAARKELRFRDPLTVNVHFTAKGVEDKDADIRVDVLHSARTSQTAQVWLSQEGVLRSVYLMTFGDLKAFKGLSHLSLSAPALPPVSECYDVSGALRKASKGHLKVFEQVDLRTAKDAPFVTSALRGQVGDARGGAIIEGWAAFSDGRAPCLRSMALFNDAYPPPVLCLSPHTPWVPTTELTVHFWSRPTITTHPPPTSPHGHEEGEEQEQQWLRVRFVTDVVSRGLLRADGEIWSADGTTLLSTSRQLARLLSPKKK